ncbi:MAG: hypothetical protein ACRD2E_05195 [Terriglobales bacterium]
MDIAEPTPDNLPRPAVLGRAARIILGLVLLFLIAQLLRGAPGFVAAQKGWQIPGGDWWILAIACFLALERVANGGPRQLGDARSASGRPLPGVEAQPQRPAGASRIARLSRFGRALGARPQVVFVILAALAAGWDRVAYGSLWAAPLGCLLLCLFLYVLGYAGLSFLVAGAAATPG